MLKRNRQTFGIFSVLLILLMGSMQPPVAVKAETSLPPQNASPDALNTYTAGEHVLQFSEEQVTITGGDRVLQLTFMDANQPVMTFEVGQGAESEGIAPFGKAVYQHLWDGISVEYLPQPDGVVKSGYYLAPGADVSDIRFEYSLPVEITAAGELRITHTGGQWVESAPVAWQVCNGQEQPVETAFRIEDSNSVGFQVGAYNTACSLVIDPAIYWISFFGSDQTDMLGGAVVGSTGDIYLVGNSYATWGSPKHAYLDNGTYSNPFVARVDKSDGDLVWNTFLGDGVNYSAGNAIALDSSGNVLVVGTGYQSWGWGSVITDYAGAGDPDIWLAKLDANGNYLWHTFIGSDGTELVNGLSCDSDGNIIIMGITTGASTWRTSIDYQYGTGGSDDLVYIKLDGSTGLPLWTTVFGGPEAESQGRFAPAIDSADNIYVSWYTSFRNGIISPPALNAETRYVKVGVMKLKSNGELGWHTYLNGILGSKTIYRLYPAVANNTLYLGGPGGDADLFTSPPLDPYSDSWKYDFLLTAFNLDGAYQWHTYAGGSTDDFPASITVDNAGDIYLGGYSGASWGTPVFPYSGGSDGVVAKFNGSGTRLWHMFFGTTGDEYINYAGAYSPEDLIIAGSASAAWGSPINDPYAGGSDVWALRLVVPPSTLTLDNTSITAQQTTVGNLTTGGGQSPYTYSLQTSGATCTTTNGAGNSSFQISGAALQRKTATGAGTYKVCIQTSDNLSNTYQKAFTITVIDIPTDISLSSSIGSTRLTDVGTLSTTNGISPFTYSLQTSGTTCTGTNGAGNSSFQISGTTLQRKSGTGAGSYNLCVQTSDTNASTYQKTFTVTIYAAPSNLSLNSTTVTTQQTSVGVLSVTGGKTPLLYSLQTSGTTCTTTNGAGNSAFQLSSTTLQRKSTTTAGTYKICAQAVDDMAVTTQKAFTITVTQSPNGLALDSTQVVTDETSVGDFTTSNGSSPYTYSLQTSGTTCTGTNGAGNGSFTISGDTLQRKAGTTKGTYNICVQTTDNLGDKFQKTFSITVLDPPSDITLSSTSGTTGLIDIGTLGTADGVSPFSYMLQDSGATCDATNGADNTFFEISTNVLKRKAATTAGTYAICIQTTDDSSRTFQKAFTIVLVDGPSVFQIDGADSTTGTSQQTDVGDFSASGTAGPYTFSLESSGAVCTAGNSTGNASFTISGTTLQRKPTTVAGNYTLCAQVEDSAGGVTQKVFTITITQSPSDMDLSNNTVSSAQTDVGDFSTSDGQSPFVYSFQTSGTTCDGTNGADNGSFILSDDLLQLVGGTAAGTYQICIQTTDSVSDTYQEAFTVIVSDPPSDIALSSNTVFAGDTNVGTFSTTDGQSPFTYSLEVSGTSCSPFSGPNNAQFQISGDSLQRKAATAPGTYDVCVQTTDTHNEIFQKTFTVTVLPSPTDIDLSDNAVSINQSVIGDFSATGGQSPYTFSLETSGDVCNAVNSAGNTDLTLAGIALSRPAGTTAGTYKICVQVTDSTGATYQEAFTIYVSEPPSGLSLSDTSVTTNESVVGTFTTTDGQPVYNYSLETSGTTCDAANGADNASFFTSGNALARQDTTTGGTYAVCVMVTDDNLETYQKAFTITVTDVAAPPPGLTISISAQTLIDNDPPGTIVGTLASTGQGVVFELFDDVSCPNNSLFAISGNQLLYNGPGVNQMENGYFTVRIKGTDTSGNEVILDVTIWVGLDGTGHGALGVNDLFKVVTGGTITVDPLINDILSTGAAAWGFSEIVIPPLNGEARIGSIIYSPDAGFLGVDPVTYRACDNQNFCITGIVEFDVRRASTGSGSGDESDVDVQGLPLPDTGFAPGIVTALGEPEAAYHSLGSTAKPMTIQVPVLGLDAEIIGIPLGQDDEWEVSWLGNSIGWLQGTAYPTWAGNTVLTGHSYDADGRPGPLQNLHTLAWGDRIVIHNLRYQHTYQVQSVDIVSSDDRRAITTKERDWITLVTCSGYDEKSGSYLYRTVVRAVFVSTK